MRSATNACPQCGLEAPNHAANCLVPKVQTLVAVCDDMNERVGRLERRAAYRQALSEKLIDCALDSDAAGRPDGALADTALLLRQVIYPWCGCKGPFCEGLNRNAKVLCLGYQIDSDGGAV